MAAGKPVVVTRTCPCPSASPEAGFWVEQTGDAIADGVNGHSSPTAPPQKRWAAAADSLISSKYSCRAAARLHQAYERLPQPLSTFG